MSMKSVEMQIAIPRTSEAGRIQQDQQHRPLNEQTLLAGQNIKNSELERRRSANIDESAHNTTVRREGNASFDQEQDHSQSEEKQEEQAKKQPAEHPYKGRHIDFSL